MALGGEIQLWGERPQEPLLFLFVQIPYKRDSETTGADLTPLKSAVRNDFFLNSGRDV